MRLSCRAPLHFAVMAAAFGLLSGCGASATEPTNGSPHDAGSDGASGAAGASADGGCSPSGFRCSGAIAVPCEESDEAKGQDCSAIAKVCVDGLGCRLCVPGAASCAQGIASYCSDDGTATVSFECDEIQGMKCEATGCTGSCASVRRSATSAGCEFWPTVTANTVWKQWFSFGVLLTNLTDKDAAVTITRGQEVVEKGTISANGMVQIELPWIEELKGPQAKDDGKVEAMALSMLLQDGGYRLRSDQPITAMQFSTTQSENPTGMAEGCPDPSSWSKCFSYSNDASLLIPSASLGNSYSLSGWHSWRIDTTSGPLDIGDFIAVTAIQDGTSVKLTASGPTLGGSGIPALAAGESTSILMNRGEVLQVFTDGSKGQSQWGGGLVEANRAVQVLSGSPCANVPEKNQFCDHLEEVVIPDSALGTSYIATAPKGPEGATSHLVRIHSFHAGTLLEFEPGEVQSPVTIGVGEVFQVSTDKNFEIKSSYPVAVSQFLTGTAATDKGGIVNSDPSQTVLVPKDHYLKDYGFSTSSGYVFQDAAVVAPTGRTVKVQGKALEASAFLAIGASGMSVAHVDLQPNTAVRITSDEPFGVQLYGYGPFTSYQLPAGMDLQSSAKK